MKIFLIIFVLFLYNTSFANNIGVETQLEIPRFVSLKSDKSNLRVGPSKNYPIKLTYVTKNYPLMIIDEYNDWRKIVDFEDNTGWIHKSLIKGDRFVIINSNDNSVISIFNSVQGKQIGGIYQGSIIQLSKCKSNWCSINYDNKQGWIEKKFLWGIKSNEILNIGYSQFFIDNYFKLINLIKDYLTKHN